MVVKLPMKANTGTHFCRGYLFTKQNKQLKESQSGAKTPHPYHPEAYDLMNDRLGYRYIDCACFVVQIPQLSCSTVSGSV